MELSEPGVISGKSIQILNTNFPLWLGFFLILALTLLPAYMWGSGGFQLVDLPLAIIILWVLFTQDRNSKYLSIIYPLVPFVLYALLVNICYILYTQDISFFKGAIPIVYGPILIYTFCIVFSRITSSNKINYIYLGILFSIIVTLTVKGTPDEEGRAALSFNDPNQLGYFAAILLAYVILLLRFKENENIRKTWYYICDIIIICSAHYFLLLAMSRSAIGGTIILDLCILKNIRNIKVFFIIIITCIMGFVFLNIIKPDFIAGRIAARSLDTYSLETMERGFKGRSLSPLNFMDNLQILFGRGQGGFSAGAHTDIFKKVKGYGGESHNLFIEILRGYGIIGFSLFLLWLVPTVWKNRILKDALWVWAGLLTLNMGIYGLRWRAFWILLAFMLSIIFLIPQQNNNERAK